MKHNTVYDFLRKKGIEIRDKGGRDKVYKDGFTQEFARLYKDGLSMKDISKQLGVGFGTIQRRLDEAGIRTRPNGTSSISINMPTDPYKIGYIAGLLDGEGNLQLKKRQQRGNSIGGKAAIYNTNQEVILWLKENIGGVARLQDRSAQGWKNCWIWEIYRAQDLKIFLEALLPYLIIKRDTAATILAVLNEKLGE